MTRAAADLDELADLAEGVAQEAGALLLGYYEDGAPSAGLAASIRSKSTRTDLVTEADRASENLIVDRLRARRPDDAILAEEGASRDGPSGLTWVVDPLDGTINFVYGFPAFCVSIACVSGDERLVGVVFDPVRRETFRARRGGGASRNGTPLRLGDGPALSEALVATGFGYAAERRRSQAELLETVLPQVRDIRRAGAAALDLCWLASGRVDAYFEAGLAPWDLAAGALVVTEAAGVVELLEGIVPGAATVVAGPRRLEQELAGLLGRARLEAGRRSAR